MKGLIPATKQFVKRNSSTILTCLGASGVVLTAILAVKATPKALQLLDKETGEKGEALTNLEIIQIAGPTYIPAGLMGVTTIACIFGANVLNKRQQAVIASAYALIDQSLKDYRQAAKAVYGEDADDKIMAEIAKETYLSAGGLCSVSHVSDSNLESSCERMLFYDLYSKRYFESTIAAVINAEYHFNRNFTMRGEACINEFYEFLGIEPIENGYNIGWGFAYFEDGFTWVDFNNRHTKLEDGMECCIIENEFPPYPNYDHYSYEP